MDDLISRQDAIEALEGWMGNHEHDYYLKRVLEDIEEIPSAQKKGEWIETQSNHYKCSYCGVRAGYWFDEDNSSSYERDMSEWLSDYCPNCGCSMTGEEGAES